MKKQYSNIFRLTFITYILAILARPYISAQRWADMCLCLFLIAGLYQFLFIIYLRKKENIKFTKAFFMYVVYAISSVGCYIIIDYIRIFFTGYISSDWLGNSSGKRYYGIEAIKNNSWGNLIYIPYLIFNTIVILIYVLKNRKRK